MLPQIRYNQPKSIRHEAGNGGYNGLRDLNMRAPALHSAVPIDSEGYIPKSVIIRIRYKDKKHETVIATGNSGTWITIAA